MRATPQGIRMFARRAAAVSGFNNTHAYRYYRLSVTNTSDGAGVGLAEIQIAAAPGGSNTATGWTYTSSSDFSGGFAVANAFDGNLATEWASTFTGTWPQWAQADYGATAGNWIAANEFKITSRGLGSGAANQAPLDFTFLGSDDASAWTTLKTLTGQTWAEAETKTYTI